MTHGWMGKVLRVDLTDARFSVEDLDMKIAEDYVGDLGLGAKYLYDEVDPTCDPLGPQNKLFFATCPLTGTGAPTGNRYVVTAKSPLTGGIANSTLPENARSTSSSPATTCWLLRAGPTRRSTWLSMTTAWSSGTHPLSGDSILKRRSGG